MARSVGREGVGRVEGDDRVEHQPLGSTGVRGGVGQGDPRPVGDPASATICAPSAARTASTSCAVCVRRVQRRDDPRRRAQRRQGARGPAAAADRARGSRAPRSYPCRAGRRRRACSPGRTFSTGSCSTSNARVDAWPGPPASRSMTPVTAAPGDARRAGRRAADVCERSSGTLTEAHSTSGRPGHGVGRPTAARGPSRGRRRDAATAARIPSERASAAGPATVPAAPPAGYDSARPVSAPAELEPDVIETVSASSAPAVSARRFRPPAGAGRRRARRTARPSSSCSACRTARSPRWPRASSPGPWVAHVSGATPLAALDPHARRFSVHPLQTFTRARGRGAARRRVGRGDRGDGRRRSRRGTGARGDARAAARSSWPTTAGRSTTPAAAFASSYLVTLHRAAARALRRASARRPRRSCR